MKKTNNRLLSLLLALVMIVSCVMPALAADAVEPFAYNGDEVSFINADGDEFGMFHRKEGTTAVINGDNVVIHYVPSNKTVYDAIHWGSIEDELTRDLTFNADGTFDIILPKEKCGLAIPVAPVKTEAKGGGTTSSQYYLAIPAEDKLEDVTPTDPTPDDPTPDDPTPADERIDLEIINNTGMFKGAYAYLETVEGRTNLVVALTGKTYHYLFKGTYEEALANGDNRDNWLAYREGPDGKYEFVFPLTGDESYIPVVSISNTYLTKYEKGENPLERAFYPRQLELDREAKTLTIGDYDETVTVSVKSNVEDFKVAETAEMRVVGGPNSNNYNVAPTLQMLDDTYDQVTYPTVVEGKVSTATAELGADKTFAISLLNAPTVEAFRDKEPIDMQFRVKATGEMVTYQVTIDLLVKTITIDGEAPAQDEVVYTFVSGGDGTWTKGSGKDFQLTVKRSVDDDTTFGRFTGVAVDGKTLDKADYEAVAGSVKITLKSKYLETLSAGKHTVTVTFDDAQAETTLTVAEASADSPKTGDPGVMLWAAMAVASAAGAVALKRRKNEDAE